MGHYGGNSQAPVRAALRVGVIKEGEEELEVIRGAPMAV